MSDPIEQASAEIEKAIAVYGMAEADVMGVPEVMPQVAVEAAGLLRDAIRAGFLAVLEEATEYETDHKIEEVNDRLWCCQYHRLRRRIEALGEAP